MAEPPKTQLNLRRKTDEPAALKVAPEAEPTDEAEQSEPKNQLDNNPEEDTEMDPKDYCKDAN